MRRKLFLIPLGIVIIFAFILGVYCSQKQIRVVEVGGIRIQNKENRQSVPQHGTEIAKEEANTIKKEFEDNKSQVVEYQPTLSENGNIHPILSCSNRIIGGTIDGKYVDAITMAECIGGGEEYRLYSMTDYLGRYKGLKNEVRFSNADYYIEFEAQNEAVFGVLGNWNALPRIPTIKENNFEEYNLIIKELLSRNGLESAEISIKKALTIDVERDGTDEAFIVAGNLIDKDYEEISNGTFKDADSKYSIVLMLKRIDGYEKSIVVSECYKGTVEYDISYLADVDGDGEIELSVNELDMSTGIMEAEGYPLSTDNIYDIMEDKLIEVISVDSSPI